MAGFHLRKNAQHTRAMIGIPGNEDGLINERGIASIHGGIHKGGPRGFPIGNNWDI